MTGPLQRRFRVLIAAAATAFLCWKSVPGTAIDRAAFTTVVRGFANPPFFISGNDSHSSPWQLRTFTPARNAKPRETPTIISLGDDPEGFFQSSPPSPVDLAVILSNMQRLGAKNATIAAVLAWETPDPIGLMALDKAIGRFDSVVMAAPLSRGAVREPMPTAFRKASMPTSGIRGNPFSLPIVNRIPLPGTILGRENTLAGFQTLDAEPDSDFIPLIARWDDRLVFAFPLIAALQRLDLPLEGMEIRIGEFIKLSQTGPVVPIDRFGRMAVRQNSTSLPTKIPAERLIDGGEEILPKQANGPMILLDELSNSEPATRTFTKILPSAISTIASDTALAPQRDYPRLRTKQEVILLSIFVLLLAAVCQLTAFARNIAFLVIAAACISAQCIATGIAGLWLPGIPTLAATLAAFLISFRGNKSSSAAAATPITCQSDRIPSHDEILTTAAEFPRESVKPASKQNVSAPQRKRRKKRR